MRFQEFTKTGLAIGLSMQLLFAMQFSTMAQAEMLSTDTAISTYSELASRDTLMAELSKQEIRDQIIALGVDPAEAEARLAVLSDAEIATIVAQMEADNAGADVVGALVTVFIILLVTDLLCFTRIFPFTRCVM